MMMKTNILILIVILICNFINAQDADPKSDFLKNSINGIQLGFLGLDYYNELRLSERTSLRSDISMNTYIDASEMGKGRVTFAPSITIQPKYYYNIKSRAEAGKNISNNSGNYFGFQIRYYPSIVIQFKSIHLRIPNILFFIPTYGIRRNFAKNFNYEFKFGYGLATTFGEIENYTHGLPEISAKIGYDF